MPPLTTWPFSLTAPSRRTTLPPSMYLNLFTFARSLCARRQSMRVLPRKILCFVSGSAVSSVLKMAAPHGRKNLLEFFYFFANNVSFTEPSKLSRNNLETRRMPTYENALSMPSRLLLSTRKHPPPSSHTSLLSSLSFSLPSVTRWSQ